MYVLLGCAAVVCWSDGAALASSPSASGSTLAVPMSLAAPFVPSAPPSAAQLDADAASRTEFRGLGRDAAISLAKQTFHIEQPAWTPPGTEGGGRVESYLNNRTAVEALPHGQHVVVSSTFPLRVNSGSGMAPTSLTLRNDGEAYVPANPLVPVAISDQAAGGISFSSGLSVKPLGAGSAEAPSLVGNSVMFANAEQDTDIVAEPRPSGAEMSWVLRSQEAPESNSLAFTLPPGASLQWSKQEPGAVEVAKDGKTLLLVPAAAAQDAAGTVVPASYSISGNVLTTHVDLSGDIDFPVSVDPLLIGYYGAWEGANLWSGWRNNAGSELGCTGCFGFIDSETPGADLLQVGAGPGAPIYAVGDWSIAAPGYGAGVAGITRVDLVGVTHQPGAQSRLIATITESEGTVPVYSWNGEGGESGPLPLYDAGALSKQSIAFCAQGANGYDGGPQPLCDEVNDQGRAFVIENEILEAQSVFNYVRLEGAQITYRDTHYPNKVELHYDGDDQDWHKEPPSGYQIVAEDEGLGIHEVELWAPYGTAPAVYKETVNCTESKGWHGCPNSWDSASIDPSGLTKTGEYSLTPVAIDAAGNGQPGTPVPLFLDKIPPVIGTLTGSLGEAAGGMIGDGNYTLDFDPVDGSAEKEQWQSGVRTVEISLDGKLVDTDTTQCPEPEGEPKPGCSALSGSWTMNGQTYGAGEHTIKLVATDWVGNRSETSFAVTVNEAAYEPVGPGAVNLETGDFKIQTTDVSIPSGAADLSVQRTYDSRKPTQGADGPLGPDWLLSVPGATAEEEWQSLTALANGSVTLTDAHGTQVTFAKTGSSYSSPPGYQTETLSEPSTSPAEYQITDTSGDYTVFKQPAAGSPFVPTTVVQASAAGGLNAIKYSFTTTKAGITEPTEIVGPEPSAGACTTTLVKGCRALTFTYAESTTAKGGAPSELGEYTGRLSKVSFTAWNTAEGKMSAPITVAEYGYDTQGILRAEWDPRITPHLKTIYGYEEAEHGQDYLTAVTPPGHATWGIVYGTLAGDANFGRLLKVNRAPAATPLWTGQRVTSEEAPKTTAAVVGSQVAVSAGKWAGEPVAIGYQWQHCIEGTGVHPDVGKLPGEESPSWGCVPIVGANNPNYTPSASEVGQGVSVEVTATNGFGTTSMTTYPEEVKPNSAEEFSASPGGHPEGITEGPEGEMWFTEANSSQIAVDTGPTPTYYALPAGSDPVDITNGAEGDLWFTEFLTNKIGRITPTGTITEFALPTGSHPAFITKGPEGNLWFTDSATGRIGKITPEGAITEYKVPGGQHYDLQGITAGPDGNLWAVEQEYNFIVRITPIGGITEYPLPKAINPFAIALGPGGLWFTSTAPVETVIGKITTAGEITQYALPAHSSSESIAEGPEGDMWFTENLTEKLGRITPAGTITEYNVPASSEPFGITLGVNKHMWFTNALSGTFGYVLPPEGAATMPPAAGATVDYHVPVSGGPYGLGTKEVEAWGQKDDPTDATAIFPPDEPQSWPASKYTRATVFYMDPANHTVNVASPGGGISTEEYGKATSDVERTLTADNQELALKDTGKTAEEAQLLSTFDYYSSDGSELLASLGPEHPVKMANGEVTAGRKSVSYEYDQNSPGNAIYHLPTKTIEGVLIPGRPGGAEETRAVTNTYSGQENLGWKLHEPTGTTTTQGGELVSTTKKYEPKTGQVDETTTPAAAGKDERVPPGYIGTFGTKGTAGGDLTEPAGDAIDASGDVWAVDTGDSRLEKFSATGGFIETIGFGVSNGEAKFEICTSSCRAGIAGAGSGQFLEPAGIAISGGKVYVAEYGNDRVEIFNEKGEYLGQFGSKGTGAGQLEGPAAVAVGAGGVWVGELADPRVDKFSTAGAFLGTAGYGVSNGEAKFQDCTASCHAGIAGTSTGQFESIAGMTATATGVYIIDSGNARVEWLSEEGKYERTFGSKGTGNGQFTDPTGIALAGSDLYVSDAVTDRIQVFNTNTPNGGEYLYQFESKGTGAGQASGAEDLAANSAGNAYVVDVGDDRVVEWTPSIAGNQGAHNTKTVYYTAEGSAPCGGHAEWAGLPCEAGPAEQPGTASLSTLPVVSYTYNIWQEPATITDTVTEPGGATKKRITTLTYDAGGRPATTEITSTVDKALPVVSNEYNTATGALKKQSTPTASISRTENTLGQILTYTDASGNTTGYEYEKEKDARLLKVSDGKGTQTFSYEAITAFPSTLTDSEAGTFTATHDIEGNITSETLPNGLKATYTRNPAGEATGLEYFKTTHCTSSCNWYTDTVVPTIRSQWATQTSTLSKQNYSYSETGPLTEVQEEAPLGSGCTTRSYGLDEDSNRTSETTRAPGTEGKCATEGGTTQNWKYNTGDQLNEPGVVTEAFGNVTSLAAADAGGSPLTSSFYVDDALASIEQNSQKIAYNLDPAGRASETISTGTISATSIDHYSGPGDSPAWTSTGSNWSRDITGLSGSLAAIDTTGKIELELTDLHGDIIGTTSTSETESKFEPANETNEYGVPRTSIKGQYAWLGASQRPTELPTGIISMGARIYIPQLGRFEQTDPEPGGSANSYAYTNGDPVNNADPSGEWTTSSSYDYEGATTGQATVPLEAFIAPGAIMPGPVNMELEDELAANPPWDAASAYNGVSGGGSPGGGSGFVMVDGKHVLTAPGLPPGASCEGSVQSKKYKHEHQRLCHEIESNPWEPVRAFCFITIVATPACNIFEKVRETQER
jgi:RHS repeat-associated protein